MKIPIKDKSLNSILRNFFNLLAQKSGNSSVTSEFPCKSTVINFSKFKNDFGKGPEMWNRFNKKTKIDWKRKYFKAKADKRY